MTNLRAGNNPRASAFDTHALIWWFSDDPSLRQSIRATVEDTDNILLVSAASAWELAIKYQLGKLRKVGDLVSDFTGRVEREGFQLLPISAEHGIRAGPAVRAAQGPV